MAVLQVYISVQKLVLNSNFTARCFKERGHRLLTFSAAKTKWPPNVASAYTNGVVRWAVKNKRIEAADPERPVRPVAVCHRKG